MNDLISILNKKYEYYLKTNGKCLGGGLESVFVKSDTNGNTLKLEVFSMLPQDIKADILDLINNK